MFKLVIISVLASIVSVQCGTILKPTIGKLVSEKFIESHGNNVVHASVPLVAAVASPILRYTNPALMQQPVAEIEQPLAKTSVINEKAHGHQVIHNAQPLITKPLETVKTHVAVPTVATRELAYVAPIYYPTYPHLVAEKTVSSYGYNIQHIV